MVTFEWLPPASWKLNKIKRGGGKFSPPAAFLLNLQKSPVQWETQTPHTQSLAVKAPHTQLGNGAFVQPFRNSGLGSKTRNAKPLLFTWLRGGGLGDYLLTSWTLKNNPPVVADAPFHGRVISYLAVLSIWAGGWDRKDRQHASSWLELHCQNNC